MHIKLPTSKHYPNETEEEELMPASPHWGHRLAELSAWATHETIRINHP